MNKLLMTGLLAGGLALSSYAPPVLAQDEGAEQASEPLVRCIDVSRIRNSKVVDNQTIILYMRGGPDYKMTLAQRCSGLKMNKSWRHDAGGLGKLCEVDVIEVPILTSGSVLSKSNFRPCIIDSIVEYDEAAEEAAEAAEAAAEQN
ncbi:MAG: DUF6491 family protein [Alphaproteobacteria bacterium]